MEDGPAAHRSMREMEEWLEDDHAALYWLLICLSRPREQVNELASPLQYWKR